MVSLYPITLIIKQLVVVVVAACCLLVTTFFCFSSKKELRPNGAQCFFAAAVLTRTFEEAQNTEKKRAHLQTCNLFFPTDHLLSLRHSLLCHGCHHQRSYLASRTVDYGKRYSRQRPVEARSMSVDNVLLFQVLVDSEINHNDGPLVQMVRLGGGGDDKRSCCDAINYRSHCRHHLLVRISLRACIISKKAVDLHISLAVSGLSFVRASVPCHAASLRFLEQRNTVNCFVNRLAHILATLKTVTRWPFAPYSCPMATLLSRLGNLSTFLSPFCESHKGAIS